MAATSTPPPANGRAPSRNVRPAWVIAAVLALVAVVFIAQNRDPVSVQLFSATLSAPMWLFLTLTALIGAAVGALLRVRR